MNGFALSSLEMQAMGVVLARFPWLLVTEFLKYKDLRNLLRSCRTKHISLRLHEMLHLTVQMAKGCAFLIEVRHFDHSLFSLAL